MHLQYYGPILPFNVTYVPSSHFVDGSHWTSALVQHDGLALWQFLLSQIQGVFRSLSALFCFTTYRKTPKGLSGNPDANFAAFAATSIASERS